MKRLLWFFTFLACLQLLHAEIPEFTSLVPEATGYELVFKCNPFTWHANGYEINHSTSLKGTVTRVAYLLKLTDKNGQTTWVFTSFDPFTQNLAHIGVPHHSPVFQQKVTNLHVQSNVPSVTSGTFAEGNIEFWPCNYSETPGLQLPEAKQTFDFDDTPVLEGTYTSMQIHNFKLRQVLMAFNGVRDGGYCDIGIGTNTALAAHPASSSGLSADYTQTHSGRLYDSAELFIGARFDQEQPVQDPIDLNRCLLKGRTDHDNPIGYHVNEPIRLTLTAEAKGRKLPEDYFIQWTRRGDDGITLTGRSNASAPVTIETTLTKPGFIHVSAVLTDSEGTPVRIQGGRTITFEGGAGADTDLLHGYPEPDDFVDFWKKQRERLNAIPLKPEITLLPDKGKNTFKIYAVSIPCAGPKNRPCTGYLAIPADAQPHSLPAKASFFGYGTGGQKAMDKGIDGCILFSVNAHGFDLEQSPDYYKDFFASIRYHGQSYAFSEEENADPETAYFNGMALRLMRAFDFLMTLPEWDGKTLIAEGGSQGGLQACWAGALVPQLTETRPSIPWCCDIDGQRYFNRIHGGWRIPPTPALRYYDPINMARHIPKTCFFNLTRAGLGDYICPPSGVAVLFNNVPGPKQIHWVQGSTHGYTPPAPNQFIDIIRK